MTQRQLHHYNSITNLLCAAQLEGHSRAWKLPFPGSSVGWSPFQSSLLVHSGQFQIFPASSKGLGLFEPPLGNPAHLRESLSSP